MLALVISLKRLQISLIMWSTLVEKFSFIVSKGKAEVLLLYLPT